MTIPREMGRCGAALVDDLFFRLLLSNPGSFFSAGNANFQAGVDTAFGPDALTKAKTLFRKQKAGPGTKAKDKKPINIRPETLLVPVELETEAELLMGAAQLMIDASGTPTKIPVDNPHRNKYRVVSAPHLSDSYYTGAMAQAWEQFTALVVIFWNQAAALVQKGLVHLRSLFDDSVNVEAEIKKIEEASLTAQHGRFAEAEAAIKARQQERDAAKQAIEQERKARQGALAESLNASLKAQQTETDSALASTQAEIAAARKELDDLIAEAKRKRELTDAGLATNKPGEVPRAPKIPTADELANLADQKLSVSGTFNAAVAERLGTQGNEPVVRVLEEVRELNRQILGEARDGGIVFA